MKNVDLFKSARLNRIFLLSLFSFIPLLRHAITRGSVLSNPSPQPLPLLTCPALHFLVPRQHSVPGGQLSSTSCVYTCLLILWSCVKGAYACKGEAVKAVVVCLRSRRCQCSRVRWLDPCGRQFRLQELLPAQLAPASTKRILAPFDGLISWTLISLAGHRDEN